jgi:hypothetical protein
MAGFAVSTNGRFWVLSKYFDSTHYDPSGIMDTAPDAGTPESVEGPAAAHLIRDVYP